MPDPGHASLGVSWVGHLRGAATRTAGPRLGEHPRPAVVLSLGATAMEIRCTQINQCLWRLLLALCAIATPEAVLGECVAVLLRQWIEPRRRLHR